MPADGGIKFGQYLLLRRIARGGMAEVFLAQQRGLEGFDRRVAVKRILPHLADTPDFVKMFLGEAKLAAQLAHPNVVHIYDFGKVDNDYFIAMEYVDGVHAGQLFKQLERERMSPTLVARLGADAAAALHYAHGLSGTDGRPLDLVHRDVSPANLMISYDGIVKLCDFGIAKAATAGNQLTNPGQVKGKYAYMSPEQTIAAPLDGRSDVFSLGIVLWELLTGKTIVPRGDAIDAMRAIRDGKLPSISAIAPATPPPLAKAINWALETKREKRATASDLAQALESFIKSSPELATPMHLANWVRLRFPRDATGPQVAMPPPGGGTSVAPGTVAAPGTIAGTAAGLPSHKRQRQVTPPGVMTASSLIAASRVPAPADDAFDLQETIALDDDAKETDRTSQATILDDPGADEPTLKPGQRPVVDPRTRKAADEVTAKPTDTIVVDDAAIDVNETIVRTGPRPSPIANPGAIPTLAVAPLRTYPNHAIVGVDTTAGVRRRPPRPLLVALALGGVMVVSFVVAVIARSCAGSSQVAQLAQPAATIDARRPDAAIAMAAAPDAAVEVAIDAAVEIDAAFEPTIKPVATTLLEVHTRPEGAMVTVGDQTRASPAKFALPAGKHKIVAELPGYEPETREVELIATEHVNQEIVFARRIPGVARPTNLMGKLTIRTSPYSEVFSNGKKIGEAPFADLPLPAGSYTLTFKNPTHPTATKTITIYAGKITKLSFTLPL